MPYIMLGIIILLAVIIWYARQNKSVAKKAITFGSIMAGILFLLRLGPASIIAITNLIIILLPFIKKDQKLNPELKGMTKKEAAEILGVNEKATKDEIKQAFNTQMKKNHPDVGGSKYLAQKIIIAKKTLLDK